MKASYLFEDIITSLDKENQVLVESLHKQALGLGYMPKITAMGKKPYDWKCEYSGKQKRVLFILRINNEQWSIRCKLFNLPNYLDILEKCTEHCIASLTGSGNCENHGGGCKGPINFSVQGTVYSKCRHALVFKDIVPEDIDGIQKLLDSEHSAQ
jgi:hypothetical protein